MFKTKALLAVLGAAVTTGISVSFSTNTFDAEHESLVEIVSVDKDVQLSNYEVIISGKIMIDDETYEVTDDSVAYLTFKYDVFSKKDCTLSVDYRFNFSSVYDAYYLDHVEIDNHIDGKISNGSTYNVTSENNVRYQNWGYFPKTEHELNANETITVEEVMRIYFTAQAGVSRSYLSGHLNKIGDAFVKYASVTILDARAE